MALNILSLVSQGCVDMAAVQGYPRYQHFTVVVAGTLRVVGVSILHDEHCLPHVVVHKVHPNPHSARWPYLISLHWTFQRSRRPQEWHAIFFGLLWGGGGGGWSPIVCPDWNRAVSGNAPPVTPPSGPPHSTGIECTDYGKAIISALPLHHPPTICLTQVFSNGKTGLTDHPGYRHRVFLYPTWSNITMRASNYLWIHSSCVEIIMPSSMNKNVDHWCISLPHPSGTASTSTRSYIRCRATTSATILKF